jgi:carbon-monoxide dehydrogenase large subunit
MTANHPGSGIWQSAPRVEDEQLLRGQARFLDDVPADEACHACFVRSTQAHARIVSVDTSQARAIPGVVGVFVKKDLFGELTSWRMPLGFALAALPENTTPFVLVDHEVAFVGEAIAVVVATSRSVAEDAASLVQVHYEPLPVVASCRDAVRPDSPTVRTELSSNVLQRYTLAYGSVDEEFAQAPVLISENFWAHRGGGHPMEGRGVLAQLEKSTGTLMVWSSTQMAHELHYTLALMLGQPEERLRVITPEVGGGFGAKFMIYPEEVVIPALARKLGRSVKWVEDRREHFMSAVQERDQYWSVQLAADREGKIRGLRGTMIHDHGAYTPQGTNVPYNAASSITGPYIVPSYSLDVSVVHTNKVPVATIRGAGYPQAAFVMERMIDRLARELGLDPVECRQRNLIPADKIPYEKPLKSRAGLPLTIDSGDFPALQARAVEAADRPGFAARRQASESRGRLRGWGIANSVKPTGRGPYESVRLKIQPSGTVAIYTGALAMGQGLKTTLAQLCAPYFGLVPAAIEVLAGDTAMIGYGHGGFASRQAIMAGNAVSQAARNLREKVLKVAAAVLGVDVSVLRLSQGEAHSLDFSHRVSLARLSMLMKGVPGYALPLVDDPGLEETVHFHCDAQTYAGACHVCEVEVDPEIGHIEVKRYLAVQDSGNIINPQLAEGQVVGGVVHGLGNALFEHMAYDDQAQPLSTTFGDYLLPTAPEVPPIEVIFAPSPTSLNELGVKGVGECSTIAVPAAVVGAVEDALWSHGVRLSEFPLTPMRVAELIGASRTSNKHR